MSDAEQKRQFDNQCWSVAPSEAPCRQACPIGTDTSGYIMAIYMGDLNEAYRILSRNNALPGVCGRVCHFPCENECVRTKVEQPVAIRALKRFVVEQASEEVKNEVPLCTKKKCQKVAVIGSGPAGLAAAHSLIRKGYHVTVFERTQRVDGLLTSAIPGFILPSAVLAEDLGRLAFMGVEFVTGMSIQGKPGADKLMAGGYSAVVLTIGASGATLLPQIPYDNDNLVPGLLFLQEMIKSPDASLSRKVVVIGGGNVATDAARLCVRRGARKVRIYAIEEKDAMPAFGHELEQCEAEGVDINGGWGISKVEEKEDGLSIVLSKVTRILTTDGGIRPIFDSRQSHEYKADHLIVAVGQKVEADVLEGLGAVFSPNGTVVADDTLLGAAGVFVAGDVVIYPGTVVDAMANGRKAAEAVAAYLADIPPEKVVRGRAIKTDEKILSVLPKKSRASMPMLDPPTARKSFDEVALGLSDAAAVQEASRCINCPACGNCIMVKHQLCRQAATRLSLR